MAIETKKRRGDIIGYQAEQRAFLFSKNAMNQVYGAQVVDNANQLSHSMDKKET